MDAPAGVPVFVDGELAGHGPTVVTVVEPGYHEVLAVIGGVRRVESARVPEVRRIELRR